MEKKLFNTFTWMIPSLNSDKAPMARFSNVTPSKTTKYIDLQ